MAEITKKPVALFTCETQMSASDLRKMTFIATFLRNYFTIPFVFLMCFGGNYLMGRFNHITDRGIMTKSFIFLFAMTILLICFRTEHKNKKRVKYDGDMIIDKPLILDFYEDRVESTLHGMKDHASLPYDSFFQLMETRQYFIFYHNVNQVSLLRKCDVNDVEVFGNFIRPKFEKKYKRIKFI